MVAKNEKAAGITNNLGTFRYLILDLYTNTQLLGDSQFDIQKKAFFSPPQYSYLNLLSAKVKF